MRTNIHF